MNGLSRKSIKIGVNAAVAGAGNGLGLAAICRKLEECFLGIPVTAGALAAELAEMDDALSAVTACTLVGWIVEQHGARSFRWDSTSPRKLEWDGDHITGTGSDFFRAVAWSDYQRSWEVVETFDYAQHYALTQISNLLVNEISNGVPIQNLFGGGYDLLIWDGTCFRQAADVSFLFLSLEWLRSLLSGWRSCPYRHSPGGVGGLPDRSSDNSGQPITNYEFQARAYRGDLPHHSYWSEAPFRARP